MDTELLEYRIEEDLASTSKELIPLSLSGGGGGPPPHQSTLHYGKFYFSGLKKGQGITVANALRRVLLYDIFGIGITKVKFALKEQGRRLPDPTSLDGILRSEEKEQDSPDPGKMKGSVLNTTGPKIAVERPKMSPDFESSIHEFSTVSGMKESILELLINLRTIIWKKPSKKILSDTQQLENLSNPKFLSPKVGEANIESRTGGSDKVSPSTPQLTSQKKGYLLLNNQDQKVDFVPIQGKFVLNDLTKLPLLSKTTNNLEGFAPSRLPTKNSKKESPEFAPQTEPFFVLRAKHLVEGKISLLQLNDMNSSVPETEASQKTKSLLGENETLSLFDDFLPEIVNPEHYLATFLPVDNFESSEGVSFSCFPKLEIEFQIQKGSFTSEKDTQGGAGGGQSPSDTEFLVDPGPFFPIKKVNYTVEAQKNSTKTMLSDGEAGFAECVFFEIWTDGSIHPQIALSEGFAILESFFKQK